MHSYDSLDPEMRNELLKTVNGEAERLLRRPRAQLLGRCLWDEFPDARDSVFHANYQRALRDNVSVSFEEYYAPLDAWLSVTAYPSAEGLAVYFRDITTRKHNAGFHRVELVVNGDVVAETGFDLAI